LSLLRRCGDSRLLILAGGGGRLRTFFLVWYVLGVRFIVIRR